MRRWFFACAFAAASLSAPASPAVAENAAVEALALDVSGPTAPASAKLERKPDADVIYPHIYQAPLFGSLFAVTSNDALVDESALRYYASLHNVGRTNAEIKRLKALHPNWTPPVNIYSSAGVGVDEQPFWDLLAADRLEELHAGIALRMKSEAGWKPSRDLLVKIQRKEAIEKLVRLSDQRRSKEVLEVADGDPSILHCAYMDANWRVADAFLDLGMQPRAFEIYHAVIATCADHDERLATIRKAITRFSVEQAKSLIAMGAKSGDGVAEFDGAKIDLTRARIGALNAGKSREMIEPEALDEFFADVAKTHDRNDLSLAGWFEYNRGRYVEADKWFWLGDPGTPPGKDAAAVNFAEGHALSLLKAGRLDAALKVAFAWREASKTLRGVYVSAITAQLTRTDPPPAITDAMLQDFVGFVEGDRNFEGAQALAWYHQNRGEFEQSAPWFKAGLAWKGVDPTASPGAVAAEPVVAAAVEGYAMALARIGRSDQATEIADLWRTKTPGLRAAFVNLMNAAVNSAERASILAPDPLSHYAEMTRFDRSLDGAAALGWLAYRSSDARQAITWFRQAIVWSPNGRGDLSVNQGLALALKGAEQFVEAEEVAWAWRKEASNLRAVYFSAVIAQLARDDLRPLVSPARLDRFIAAVRGERSPLGAQAIGWLRMQQGNCAYAAPWFRNAASWSADREGDPVTARGMALSLKAVGEFRRAADIAWAWRDRDPKMRSLYVDIGVTELTQQAPPVSLSEERVQRLSRLILNDRNVSGARALGWRRYREDGCGYGGDWFRLATLWSEGAERDVKTDEGFALALRAAGRLARAEILARRWADKSPAMQKLYVDIVVEELSRDNPPEPVDEARLTEFGATIEPIKSPLGAQALGWYRLERGEWADATLWFKRAVDWWPTRRQENAQRLPAPAAGYKPLLAALALTHEDYRRTPLAYAYSRTEAGKRSDAYIGRPEALAKTTEGYALALRALGRMEEAEDIAYAWRDAWTPLRSLFVDIAAAELSRRDGPEIDRERLRRYVAVIQDSRSASAAAAMAWRQFSRSEFAGAAEWFQTAIGWSEGETDPSLVEGYVFSLRGAKKFEEATAVAEHWRKGSPRLNVLYLETSLIGLREAGQGDKLTAAKLAEVEAAMNDARSPDGALAIGWVDYQAHDFERALVWFRKAIDWSGAEPRAKAVEGVALSLRGLDRFDELAEFAYPRRETSAVVRDAYYGGMIAWLTRDKPIATVSEARRAEFEALVKRDRLAAGAQALGWGSAIRADWPTARDWFESAIGWSGFDPKNPPQGKVDAARAKLVEGYVQALRATEDFAGAEDIAYAWRGAGEAFRGLYLQIFTQEVAEDGARFTITPERMARFSALADAERSPAAAQSLGWRSYRSQDWQNAIRWFEKAIAWSPGAKGDAKINEGYALSLRAAGRLTQAEDFAWSKREQSRELRAAYIAAVSDQLFDAEMAKRLSTARIERFAGVVRADKVSAGAQALGWRRLQDGNCGYSVVWFRHAIRWSLAPNVEEKSYSGLAQGLRAVGMFNEAEDAAFAFADRSKEARQLYTNVVVEELTRQWPRVPMSEDRIARFSAVVLSDQSQPGAQAIAWRRYGQAGCGYGGEWFRRAASWRSGSNGSDDKASAKLSEGWALTQRAVGRLAAAEALVKPWVDKTPSMNKLFIDVAVEELSRDNPPEPLPEPRVAAFEATFAAASSPVGAQALGWYRYARGENEQAAKWFQNALDWWPRKSLDKNDKLSTPVDDYKPILARLALQRENYRRTPRAYPNSSLLIGRDTESYVDSPVGLAKTVEGYVLTLAALSRWEAAETLAFDWVDRWPHMRQILIDLAASELNGPQPVTLSPERLQRFAKLIEDSRSTRGAEALGWRAYGGQDFAEASRWFHAVLDWSDKGAAPKVNLIQAYAQSLREQKHYDEAMAVVAGWRDRMPTLASLSVEIGLDQLQGLDPASPEAARRLADIASGVAGAKSFEGATALGWLAYQRNEYQAALAWFKKGIVWSPAGGPPHVKALEGYARALQGLGRLNDFMIFTEQWGASVASLKALYIEAATQALAQSAGSGEDMPNDALARAGAAFAAARSAEGAQALAWQRIAMKDYVAAAAWFEAARTWSPEGADVAKIVEGQIIALRNLRRDDEAEALAFEGAEHDENLRNVYVEIGADRLTRKPPAPPDPKRLRRYAAFVLSVKSANGAQALGWYSYNVRQLPAAIAWFETSLSFEPSENAALGLAFAYRKAGDRVGFARVVSTYRGQFGKIADLSGTPRALSVEERRAALEADPSPARPNRRPASDDRESRRRARVSEPSGGSGGSIASALDAKDYVTCVARAEEAERRGSLNVGQRNAEGWCLLNLKRPQESLHAFEASFAIASGKQRHEAAYGKSLALLAGGQPMQAGRAAADADLNPRQRNDVGVWILSQRAWNAYNAQRYAESLQWLDRRAGYQPETRDLMQLRSWDLRKLGRADDATAIQERLDAQLMK